MVPSTRIEQALLAEYAPKAYESSFLHEGIKSQRDELHVQGSQILGLAVLLSSR